MGVLAAFERRLSSLVEGAFARVFKGGVEPVEIAGALQRETDAKKVLTGRRTLVPNAFVVELGTTDSGRLTPYSEPLTSELSAMVREHAAASGYTFSGPVTVRFASDPDLDTGVFRVHAEVSPDGAFGPPPSAAPPSPPPARPAPPVRPSGGAPQPLPRIHPRLLVTAAPEDPRETPGPERTYELASAVTRIGRASDVDLRLEDTAVSRYHAELRRSATGHVLVDTGSTNGTSVNGRRVDSAELRNGDRIEVGGSTLVYRSDEAPSAGAGWSGRAGSSEARSAAED